MGANFQDLGAQNLEVENLTVRGATSFPSVSAQIRIAAVIDGAGVSTITAAPISLTGGVVFGGLDQTRKADGYIKVLLTLPQPIADANKVPIPGIHLPSPPPSPFLSTLSLYVPPVPLQGVVNTDASMLVILFSAGQPNTTEVIDVTYDLAVVRR